MEDLGRVDFEQECKKRNKVVYVPNWFNVDLKTGVCIFFVELNYFLGLNLSILNILNYCRC